MNLQQFKDRHLGDLLKDNYLCSRYKGPQLLNGRRLREKWEFACSVKSSRENSIITTFVFIYDSMPLYDLSRDCIICASVESKFIALLSRLKDQHR